MILPGYRWEAEKWLPLPVHGPPELSARACESHTCSESPLTALQASKARPIPPAHLMPCTSAGQVQKHFSFFLCLLAWPLDTVNGLWQRWGRAKRAHTGTQLLPGVTRSLAPHANGGGERRACPGPRAFGWD